MSALHRVTYRVRAKRGLLSTLFTALVSNAMTIGQILWTRDTEQLFIHNGYVPKPVQTLDMAVVDEDFDLVIDEDFNLVYDY